MATLRVGSNPHGRATKEALDHLQTQHPTGTFGIEEMPGSDPVQNVTVLGDLRRAGLIEQLGSEEYQLTREGRDTSAEVEGDDAA